MSCWQYDRPASKGARQWGFTLLEVLIALTILAISSLAVIRQIGQSTINLAQLEQKTLAALVADRRIAQYRIAENWPPLGSDSELTEMAGRQWRVDTEVVTTSEPLLRKLTVAVALDSSPNQAAGKVPPLTEFIIYRGAH